MATVVRVGKLRVMVYSRDHPPPHVHVVAPRGEFMTERSWIRAELGRNLARANRSGQAAAKAEPRAVEARYLPASRHLRVRLANGASLSLPVSVIPELRGASRAHVSAIEILPGGDALHWEALDFTISVPGLVASLFGRSTWMSELGRLGGARSTLAKAAAARRNGMRGGRPRVAQSRQQARGD